MARDWILGGLVLVLVAGIYLALSRQVEELPEHQRQDAWLLGRSEGVEGARRLYLRGQFVDCLKASPGEELRKLAEDAWLVECDWPASVQATLRRDLDGDGQSDLIKLVARDDRRSFVVLRSSDWSNLEPAWLDLAGQPLDEGPQLEKVELESTNLTGAKDFVAKTEHGWVVGRQKDKQLQLFWLAGEIKLQDGKLYRDGDPLIWKNGAFSD
ncbi:MAG: hypothetical protein KC910_09770 [Candidatus Eremiobacteraeota bacterium]|nr:hypothetical protein [Candidatus Eremiobacteraeota bacterium]